MKDPRLFWVALVALVVTLCAVVGRAYWRCWWRRFWKISGIRRPLWAEKLRVYAQWLLAAMAEGERCRSEIDPTGTGYPMPAVMPAKREPSDETFWFWFAVTVVTLWRDAGERFANQCCWLRAGLVGSATAGGINMTESPVVAKEPMLAAVLAQSVIGLLAVAMWWGTGCWWYAPICVFFFAPLLYAGWWKAKDTLVWELAQVVVWVILVFGFWGLIYLVTAGYRKLWREPPDETGPSRELLIGEWLLALVAISDLTNPAQTPVHHLLALVPVAIALVATIYTMARSMGRITIPTVSW